MKGFLIAAGMLVLSTVSCGASFFSGNTGLALPMLLAFYVMSLATAFYAGRAVDLQSPFKPRAQEMTEYRRSRAAPPANGRATSLLAKVKAGQPEKDEFS